METMHAGFDEVELDAGAPAATPAAADAPVPPGPGTIFSESRLGMAFSPDPVSGEFPAGVSCTAPPLIGLGPDEF